MTAIGAFETFERRPVSTNCVEKLCLIAAPVNDHAVDSPITPVCTASMYAVKHVLWRDTFSSLKIRNYRVYFYGQSVSLVGTWMQMTAQAWLVLPLTPSATALGLVTALQTLPVLLLGPYGGVIADRVDKRRLMIVLQSLMGVQAAPELVER